MVEKIAFTKEEIESRVKVPAIVEVELKHLIEERLKQSGLYYRIFSRIKTSESLARKYQVKSYNAEKKIQDLVGLRVDVYFEDDLRICRRMMEHMFSLVEWSESEQNESEFKPVKINGVFRLPDYLKQQISDETWEMCIDDTFEIQLKTVFFEGWHEIEHDMRYKGSAFGIGNEALARKMNSILATFELCDDSIVGLLEDLGHQHYKDKKWNDMLRCHYRLKFENEPLHPYIEELFDEDTELAKIFYKFKRPGAIEQLWMDTSEKGIELTVNNIVRIVNQIGPDDERLNEAFRKIDHEKGQDNETVSKRRKFEPFKKLGTYKVFQSHSAIDLTNLSMEDAYKKAVNYIYSWIKSRFLEVFDDLPESVGAYENEMPGYKVSISYDPEEL